MQLSIIVLHNRETFPEYQVRRAGTELSHASAALELGVCHYFISLCAGVAVQGRKQISFF